MARYKYVYDDDDDDDDDYYYYYYNTVSFQHTFTVGKLSALGQPTRPTQPSILPGSANE